ncbi:hypothetical protein Cgig2_020049 [Carnegiea gigantea]|uniref:Ubiquitin-like protease family profile domain-containing protein n=1 Tax=Carnegiea gigantea TaxID=171969 RepID=A0A9Q1JJA2_9CARY|nr:hypothetical protein Cgig2_020049 [Carnegiea gigantea]
MKNSTHNLTKVQLFETVLEDKGASFACKGNCEQRSSLYQRINFIENPVVKVSSNIISLKRVVKENKDTLNMLNANINRLMKHVLDNETTKSNKHVTDTCATTYIDPPSSVGGLNFWHNGDKKVNVNKVYIPMNDRVVHWFLIVVDLQHRHVALLNSLPLNKSNDYRRELAKDLIQSYPLAVYHGTTNLHQTQIPQEPRLPVPQVSGVSLYPCYLLGQHLLLDHIRQVLALYASSSLLCDLVIVPSPFSVPLDSLAFLTYDLLDPHTWGRGLCLRAGLPQSC